MITGLDQGHFLTSLCPSSSLGAPGLGWLEQVVLAASGEGVKRTCIVWDPPEHSRRKSKVLDVVAVRLDHDQNSEVAVIIREIADEKRVDRTLWRRNSELRVLNRASQMISRSLNPDEVMTSALDISIDLFHASAGKAVRVDGQVPELVTVAEKEKSGPLTSAWSDLDSHRMAVQAAKTGLPVLATRGWGKAASSSANPSSYACVPLKATDRILGVLQVCGGRDFFLENNPWLLESFGSQAGIALENAQLHDQVKEIADFDGLTGALTRQRIDAVLRDKIRSGERYGERFAVLMVDIDRFKSFNDVHGHEVGDQVLKSVAGIILGEIRESDYVGRWGGEEFVVVLAEVDEVEAMTAAERIRLRIATMYFASEANVEVPVTVSIGVACYPRDSGSSEGLVRFADDAMRFAKRSGRNLTQSYAPDMADASVPSAHRVFRGTGLGTIKALAAALDAKDNYTDGHSHGVKQLAAILAREMMFDEERIETLEMAALLHDIGKVAVPDSILNKPGPLDENEWAIMREHPRMGVMILREAPQLSRVLPVILHHHERFDGMGYPEGKKGNAIPVLSRILCVADSFTAATTSRPYRKAIEPRAALKEIERCRGSQFDPDMVKALSRVVKSGRGTVL